MSKKIVNIIVFLIFFSFFFLIIKYYFSEENKIFTNKSRTSYLTSLNENKTKLPILKNDTENIITYSDDIKEFKKNRKKRIWEKLISNTNE
tara:strand:+ start:45 stop:317 length:273 start_codon:yes stop_codon:yes gene_type:complete